MMNNKQTECYNIKINRLISFLSNACLYETYSILTYDQLYFSFSRYRIIARNIAA